MKIITAPPSRGGAHGGRRLFRIYHLIWGGLSIAILLIVALGYQSYVNRTPPNDPPGVQNLPHPEPAPLFNLMNQDGKPFSTAALRGKWTIMLFGYTHCPDFCPTTLATFNNTIRRLTREQPDRAADTQLVFVSVDPFRDTPQSLKSFVAHFNPHFIGVTGTPAEIHKLADPLGMSYDYADSETGEPLGDTLSPPKQPYDVNHGAGVYIFDDKARLVGWVYPPHTMDRFISVFGRIRRQYD